MGTWKSASGRSAGWRHRWGSLGWLGRGKTAGMSGRWWGHYQRRRGMSSGSYAGAAGVLAGRDTPRAGPRKVTGPGHRPGGHRMEVRRSAPAAEHQPGPHGRRGPLRLGGRVRRRAEFLSSRWLGGNPLI